MAAETGPDPARPWFPIGARVRVRDSCPTAHYRGQGGEVIGAVPDRPGVWWVSLDPFRHPLKFPDDEIGIEPEERTPPDAH